MPIKLDAVCFRQQRRGLCIGVCEPLDIESNAAGDTYDSSKVMELGIIVSSESGKTLLPTTLTIDEVALTR